jgi:predicted nuclease of restriction endonuclease-like (RecB) superfamily
MKELAKNNKYIELIRELKKKVKSAQIKAALAVNSRLVILYWGIGTSLIEAQKSYNWGDEFIKDVSRELSNNFPDMRGFSTRNVKYMRQFASLFTQDQFGQQVAAQIPWGHNMVLLDKKFLKEKYLWYAEQTIKNGWSRNVLDLQIASNLYERQAKTEKIHNFHATLPPLQSNLAHNLMKDPYALDFLNLTDDAHEREIEKGLVHHIQKFLMELGQGFAFVGNQYHLEVGGDDYYIDLLFYHLKLRCFVVIEIKSGKFKPADAGQLNFYLSVIDDILKHPSDNPSIGLLLCKDKNKISAEYSLKDSNKPIGLAAYKLLEEIASKLPSIEELENELNEGRDDKTI